MNIVKSHPAFNKLFINDTEHAIPMIIDAFKENSENCAFDEFCQAIVKFADDYVNTGLRYEMPDHCSKEAISSKIKGDIFEILSSLSGYIPIIYEAKRINSGAYMQFVAVRVDSGFACL